VAKYFDIWANVIISPQKRYPQKLQRIAYIDLFTGPGRYRDSTQSTPLKILTNSIVKPDLPIDYADATTACLAIDTGIENIVTFDKKDFNIYGSEKKSDFYHNAVIRYDL